MNKETLDQMLTVAAKLLGDSLLALNYPNNGTDGVFAEANLIMHAAHALMNGSPPFHCYAEAAHSNSRRIDLLAHDGEYALAFEAKKFGDIEYGSSGVLEDIARLREFKLLASKTNPDFVVNDWWISARERWAVILIGSHAGNEVADAWVAPDAGGAAAILACRRPRERASPTVLVRKHSKLIELIATIDEQANAHRCAAPICLGTRWQASEDATLLWASFRLP
jgi:hypothetical protein